MRKKMKYTLFFLLLFAGLRAAGQRTEYPLLGAQVFVEPGQTASEIDRLFRTLAQNDMQVARIRLFGAHMLRSDDVDFRLYDAAFDAAQRHGIRLFATLFPPTDELKDVGGFKFPRSKAHLEEVRRYIRTVVPHFASKPALYAWVLQNEPGTGGRSVPRTDLSDSVRQAWSAGGRQENGEAFRSGYLTADFSEERFLKDYTTWYLGWIADEVRRLDDRHPLHVNPHALLSNLPEYDFPRYEQFLTSLGLSMHMSWHFGDFTQEQYPVGVAMMCDVIREKAGRNPFWITELQGGNVTASGAVPFCPTAAQIRQYLWTGIASGCEGVVFWTLNARRSVMEAGEWALLNYEGQPSDRLKAAARVARTLTAHKALFAEAEPFDSPVSILYNEESLAIQRRNGETIRDDRHEGRKPSAVMRSVITAYRAVAAHGITPNLASMDHFDWDPVRHPAAVLPHSIALPRAYHAKLREYVRRGGRLLVTGLSGYYDERMICQMMGGFPLAECFGARVTEFKVTADCFDLHLSGDLEGTLPAHLWRGILRPTTARCIGRYGDDVCATHNVYGKGEVYWIPSPIHLGSCYGGDSGLAALYGTLFRSEIARCPLRFESPEPGVLMRVMRTPGTVVACIVNTTSSQRTLRLVADASLRSGRIIDSDGSRLSGSRLSLAADDAVVCIWEKAPTVGH